MGNTLISVSIQYRGAYFDHFTGYQVEFPKLSFPFAEEYIIKYAKVPASLGPGSYRTCDMNCRVESAWNMPTRR